MDPLAIAGSLALGVFHLLAPLLEHVPVRHRAALASMSGGAGLAYVFLYLLFELATEGAPQIHALAPLGPAPLETLFMMLLFAICATYVVQMRLERTSDPRHDHRGSAMLYLTYNVLAGAGVVEEAQWGPLNLFFYVAAIGFHLLFNDRFLLHVSPSNHSLRWRIPLAAAPVAGCALAVVMDLPVAVLYALLALVAGGTIINVLRRELPALKRFRPVPFVAGVVLYASLILATWRF